jgi:hypothetical protein
VKGRTHHCDGRTISAVEHLQLTPRVIGHPSIVPWGLIARLVSVRRHEIPVGSESPRGCGIGNKE